MAVVEQKADERMEYTLALIKPDAVKAGKAADIIARIEKEGFSICIQRDITLTKEKAERFYAEYKERSVFGDLIRFMTSGPIIGLKLKKKNAIADWRALMGPTNSEEARKHTVHVNSIRALYGTNAVANATHGSENREAAERELNYLFPRVHVGFIAPRDYMKEALKSMNDRYIVHFLEPKGWDKEEMDKWIEYCKDNNIVCVCGYAQKDAFHHILLNEALGNPVPSRKAFLYGMNKYLMRTLDRNAFWYDSVDPMKENFITIASKIKEYPFMLKNTSLSLGQGIFSVSDEKTLKTVINEYKADKELQENIAYQMSMISKDMNDKDIPQLPPFIIEHKVDANSTIEYCYEGFITADGKLVHYAMSEEVYFANHQALGYLTPPMSLTFEKCKLIEAWIVEYMQGFIDLGWKNQFFNIELWLSDKDEIFLTEINPRAAPAFHYMYLNAFGTRLLDDNMELARGADMSYIEANNPYTRWFAGGNGNGNDNDGTYNYNYSLIVLLTAKQTGKVSDIFDYDYVKKLECEEGILIRHDRQADDVLTDKDMIRSGCLIMQAYITGKTSNDIMAREIEIREKIYKIKQPGAEYPAYWKAA